MKNHIPNNNMVFKYFVNDNTTIKNYINILIFVFTIKYML